MKKFLVVLNEEDYKKFKAQSIMMNKSSSERIREFIKKEIEKEK